MINLFKKINISEFKKEVIIISVFFAGIAALHSFWLYEESYSIINHLIAVGASSNPTITCESSKDVINAHIGYLSVKSTFDVNMSRVFVPSLILGLRSIFHNPQLVLLINEFIAALFAAFLFYILCSKYIHKPLLRHLSALLFFVAAIGTQISIGRLGDLFTVSFFCLGLVLINARGWWLISFAVLAATQRFDIAMLSCLIWFLSGRRIISCIAGAFALIVYKAILYHCGAHNFADDTVYIYGTHTLRCVQLMWPSTWITIALFLGIPASLLVLHPYWLLRNKSIVIGTALYQITLLIISCANEFRLMLPMLAVSIIGVVSSYENRIKE